SRAARHSGAYWRRNRGAYRPQLAGESLTSNPRRALPIRNRFTKPSKENPSSVGRASSPSRTSELQNIPEAAPKASPSFSVSEKLARYGCSSLSGVEHLRLLVGKDSVADALLRHFGSLKAFSRL